ncbi:MAG: molybdopterin-guanine dinucleotide biosynthesis protein B [Anaerolineae bacterium]|nr:molybdopterin-guanine dinucleotide biosynthesis protein B [Anaerolineae bacterium]MDW8070135.1 molybdopterin-guanine dinucleotide biosynthesis protein B [Anaerolineae bacterium]
MSSNVADGPAVVCFVARSGTGKTTLLEKLIPRLKARGLRVGVLKHHAHATAFDIPGKDSYRLAQSGADIVVGASAAQVAVFYPADGPPDLEALIARHLQHVDLVLVEGYKEGPHPKIEVCRAAYALRDANGVPQLMARPEELLALVSDCALDLPVPHFGLDDADRLAEFLRSWMQQRVGESN